MRSKRFYPLAYFDRKEARKFDLVTQLGLASVTEVISDSKILESKFNPLRAGVIWATGIGGIITFEEEVKSFSKGDGSPRFNPFFIPKMIADITAGHIGIQYNFQGPNYATLSACASAGNAFADAINLIRLNKADVFIVGGSEAAISASGVGGFNLCMLSTRVIAQKHIRPFIKIEMDL